MSSPIRFSARLGSLILLLLTFCSVRCQAQAEPQLQAQAFACPVTQPAPAGTPIQWTIHVRVALDSDKKIKYKACPFPTPADPASLPAGACPEYVEKDRDIHLCKNDTVVWYVHTKGSAHGSALLFQPDSLLGQLVFFAQEPTASTPGTVGQDHGAYEYYVAALDKDDNGKWYPDDPKMIVGGSNTEVLAKISDLLNQADLLADSLRQSEVRKQLKKDIRHAQELLPKTKPQTPQ